MMGKDKKVSSGSNIMIHFHLEDIIYSQKCVQSTFWFLTADSTSFSSLPLFLSTNEGLDVLVCPTSCSFCFLVFSGIMVDSTDDDP